MLNEGQCWARSRERKDWNRDRTDVREAASATTEMQQGHKETGRGGTTTPEGEDRQRDLQWKVRDTSSRYCQRVTEDKEVDLMEGTNPSKTKKTQGTEEEPAK